MQKAKPKEGFEELFKVNCCIICHLPAYKPLNCRDCENALMCTHCKDACFQGQGQGCADSDKGRCQDRQQEIQGLFQGESKDAGS